MDRRYALLRCPACGQSPSPCIANCPGCGRVLRNAAGCLDLLSDKERQDADWFAARYRALRAKEGWSDSHGREDPDAGRPEIWRDHARLVQAAASTLHAHLHPAARPVIIDVGSGGGWAARYLKADVISVDLFDAASAADLCVRADMRNLPIFDASIDGLLYAASMHYAPLEPVVHEAGRVLRTGGALVMVNSPIYTTHDRRDAARARTVVYYERMGFPEMASRYNAILADELRSALGSQGFRIERFEVDSPNRLMWPVRRRPPGTFVAATRLPLT